MEIKRKIKKAHEYYAKPTPKFWRKIGDSLLAISLTAIPLELSGYRWLSVSLLIAGILGKFLTNFFADESRTN
jgi:hypothetical protein